MPSTGVGAYFAHAAASKGSARTGVPPQGVEVESIHGLHLEDLINEQFERFATVASVPVLLITNEDAEFALATDGVDVVDHAVADVPAIESVDGVALYPRCGVLDLGGEVTGEVFQALA